MRAVSFVVFIVLQIIFLPLAIGGAVLVGYKQVVVSKRLRVSQTGIEVLNGRWTLDVFDIRKDPATMKLAAAIPNTSTFGLWLVLFPLWLKYKISGSYFGYPRIPKPGHEQISDLMIARTLYFDRIIERRAPEVAQFVLMGAGYDARAYGELKKRGLRFFELDHPATQKLKTETLWKAGIDSAHVTFIPVDFSQENVSDKLRACGYNPQEKTLFLWEGVTLYLSEEDVRKTLQNIREHAAQGSVIVADFYGDRTIKLGTGSASRKTLEYTQEGLDFGLPFATNYERTFREFVESEGFDLGETVFMGHRSSKGPFVVIAELGV
ncbi:MAG: class I SAM-dependent methyltransferase [Myxococcota bacterium]